MSVTTGVPRTILGPLETTYSLPSTCMIAIQGCLTCSQAWQGQTCISTNTDPYYGTTSGFVDNTNCWPPRASFAITPSAPLGGWGFYSPGLACPAGLTSACSATGGASSGWSVEYGLLDKETAVGCCPSGFSCTNNGFAQMCQQIATQTSFQAVTCESGTSGAFTILTVPETITPASDTTTTISQYSIYAPLIQINWQASDRSSTGSTPSIPTSTSEPLADAPSSGLSLGAKAGIGIGAALGALAMLGLAFFIYRRRQTAYSPARQQSPIESPYEMQTEMQTGKRGSDAVPELPSGTQVSELGTGGVKAEQREVHEMGS